MSDSLTTLIGKVQNILGDASGTYFTTAICTAAIRQALSEWNLRAPQFLATTIVGVNSQYEYELTDVDSLSCEIIDILLRGTDTAQDISKSQDFDQYIEDERLFFRLRSPRTTSDTLIVRYTEYHTINGLDSAVESTLLAKDDQAMVDGGAFFSIMIRATARVETINLSQDQSDNYRELAGAFGAMFSQRLSYASQHRKPAVSEPDTRAWNDAYYTNQWRMK
jgi:hypothetical protein